MEWQLKQDRGDEREIHHQRATTDPHRRADGDIKLYRPGDKGCFSLEVSKAAPLAHCLLLP